MANESTPSSANARAVERWVEISELRGQAARLNDELKAAKRLAGEVGGFGNEISEHRARLEPLDLVPMDFGGGSQCPICLSLLAERVPTVVEMRRSLARITDQLQAVQTERPRLAEVIGRMQAELSELGNHVNERRRAYESATAQQLEFASTAEGDNRRAHVVGRISLYLESIPAQADTDFTQLERDIVIAASRVATLENWFEELDLEERLAGAINLIGRRMSEYENQLQMEWRENPLRLDLRKLTVTADRPADPVTMDRMGSAENWLACHLIAHLALHEFFVSAQRPVPGS